MTASPFRPVTLINGAEWAAADCRCLMIDNPTFLQCGSVWLLWPLPREALAETPSTRSYSSPRESWDDHGLRLEVHGHQYLSLRYCSFPDDRVKTRVKFVFKRSLFHISLNVFFILTSPCNNSVLKICRSTHKILKTNNCLNPQTNQIK